MQCTYWNRETMQDKLNKVIKLYNGHGFEVIEVIADIEFEYVRDNLERTKLTTVAQDNHVGDIENLSKMSKTA